MFSFDKETPKCIRKKATTGLPRAAAIVRVRLLRGTRHDGNFRDSNLGVWGVKTILGAKS